MIGRLRIGSVFFRQFGWIFGSGLQGFCRFNSHGCHFRHCDRIFRHCDRIFRHCDSFFRQGSLRHVRRSRGVFHRLGSRSFDHRLRQKGQFLLSGRECLFISSRLGLHAAATALGFALCGGFLFLETFRLRLRGRINMVDVFLHDAGTALGSGFLLRGALLSLHIKDGIDKRFLVGGVAHFGMQLLGKFA